MRVPKTLVLVLMVGAYAAGSRAEAASASAEGYWLVKGHGFVVRISECGQGICGELAGLNESPRPDHLRLDAKNPDPAKRGRQLCGLPLFGGFKPAAETGKWQGGWVYNPDDGRTYSGEIRMTDPNTIAMRGSVLGGLLGKTLTLTRQSRPQNLCEPRERFAVN